MAGFLYRMAIAIKDYGERKRKPRVIRLGLRMRDWVGKRPIKIF